MKNSKLWFFTFVGPVLVAFIIVVIIPTLMGIYFSFTNWDGINHSPDWVGLRNYFDIFERGGDFLDSFVFTAKFAATTVVTINLIGFSLALLVTSKIKHSNVVRSVFFMPNLIGGLILGFVWRFIFTNAFNYVGEALEIDFLQGWLATTATGFWGLVIVMTWQLSGYMMIIYIAALQNIPKSLIEAAEIDGATSWQKLKNITIPLVAPAFTIGLFLTLSNSFKLFDQNLSLTGGGPFNSTVMLALNIYETAFVFMRFGRAQAKAVVFLIVVAIITLTQIYFSKRKEVEM
ncbi:MAG: carbohydrate ABC transporter permease [Alkaliphilus sp.]